jgi:LmbE family N-acetylglucosaminyl deacetylase
MLKRLKTEKYKTVLVFTAHPDDLEGFAGGVVYELCGVHSFIYSGGDRGAWGKKYKRLGKQALALLRIHESDEAEKVLKIKSVVDFGYHDRHIPIDAAAVDKALEQIKHYKPDAIFSFEYKDWLTFDPHPDHLAVAHIVKQAILEYKDRASLDYYLFATWAPTHFVDVSKVRPIKMRALARHRSQRSLNRIIFPFLERIPSKIWGIFNGTSYAEGYRKVNIRKMKPGKLISG